MKNNRTLNITVDKKTINIPVSSVLYVVMEGNNANIHLPKNKVYQTRMTLSELQPMLGENFIKVKRGCLVSIFAIHDFADKVNLINGEELDYATRHKTAIVTEFKEKQENVIHNFNEHAGFSGVDGYREYYKLFDNLPVAFCDIEMIFDSEFNAVDWKFCYANENFAKLEKIPLQTLIGNTFGNLFPNINNKWLKSYERATLFGETIKIIDYSPEIDTYLDIICFKTFPGHCGCILFDISKINSYRNATDAEKAMTMFFTKLMKPE